MNGLNISSFIAIFKWFPIPSFEYVYINIIFSIAFFKIERWKDWNAKSLKKSIFKGKQKQPSEKIANYDLHNYIPKCRRMPFANKLVLVYSSPHYSRYSKRCTRSWDQSCQTNTCQAFLPPRSQKTIGLIRRIFCRHNWMSKSIHKGLSPKLIFIVRQVSHKHAATASSLKWSPVLSHPKMLSRTGIWLFLLQTSYCLWFEVVPTNEQKPINGIFQFECIMAYD